MTETRSQLNYFLIMLGSLRNPTGGREWGADSVSAPIGAAIRDCIEGGGTPADIQCCLGDPVAVAASVAEFDLMRLAMCRANMPFVKYFAEKIRLFPPGAANPLHNLAIECHAPAAVIEYLRQTEPIAGPAAATHLFLWAATHHNLAALDMMLGDGPAPPDVLGAARAIMFWLDDYKWLLRRGMPASDFDCFRLLRRALVFQQHDIVEWLLAELDYSPDVTDPAITTELLRAKGFSWLLRRRPAACLFALSPDACVLAALEHGDPAVFDQFPANWFRQVITTSAYHSAAASKNPETMLKLVAARLPADFNEILLAMYRIPARALAWFHKRSPLALDALLHIAACGLRQGHISYLDFLSEILPAPAFAAVIETTDIFDIGVVVWVENYCASRGLARPNMLRDPARLLCYHSGSRTDNAAKILQVFDRLPPSVFLDIVAMPDARATPAHRKNVLRLWWQHQRAKFGIIIVAARRSARTPRALPRLPAELCCWIASEFLNGC